jgi:DNA-nicking Smr family endonuclease
MFGWWRRRAVKTTETETETETDADPAADTVTALPITDELDLHHFQPRDVASVVAEYLHEAHARGLVRVRLVHGKGTGALRRTVHATLERHPAVRAYRLADERAGSWGATLVDLHPPRSGH